MSETEARVWTALVLLALVLAAGWALGAFGGRTLRRRAAAFATRAGLPDAGRDPTFVARVGRRQRAASAADLATDDAFRAQAVRDALQLTTALSVAVALGLATALQDDDVIGSARQLGGWAPLALLVAVAVVGTVHELVGGPRHWRGLHRVRQPA